MYLCYVDEAGCTGKLPSSTSSIQPIFAIVGILVKEDHVKNLTMDFLHLKKRFYPGELPSNSKFMDWVKLEIKGKDLRKSIRTGGRNEKRHALNVMGSTLKLLEDYNVKIVGRLYVKGIDEEIKGNAMYAAAVQSISTYFHHYTKSQGEKGLILLDSRLKHQNENVSHSVFTQKFKSSGDEYPSLIETPVFAHSDNHACIQLADLICSAFLYPLGTYAYCEGHVTNVHVSEKYEIIRDKFGVRLKALQYRYRANKKWLGGIVVNDKISKKTGKLLFNP